MNRRRVYLAWAPDAAVWSDWIKPVLFSYVDEDAEESATAPPLTSVPKTWLIDEERASAASLSELAVIVDLPGTMGVSVALGLAEQGLRPVPLYNSLPGSEESLVDSSAILSALTAGTGWLRERALPIDAPPAFLLDSQRRSSRFEDHAGRFDNRWVVFTTDFPSAQRLAESGIRRALLLRAGDVTVPGDLVPVLAAWKRGGIALRIKDITTSAAPSECALPRASWLNRLWFEMLVPLGLKRQNTGEFGGLGGSG